MLFDGFPADSALILGKYQFCARQTVPDAALCRERGVHAVRARVRACVRAEFACVQLVNRSSEVAIHSVTMRQAVRARQRHLLHDAR